MRDPGCWDHIGRHMSADADPIRPPKRTGLQSQPHSALARAGLAVMLMSLLFAVVRCACRAW